MVVLTGIEVTRVSDEGAIPRSLPVPALPDLSLISVDLVVNAVAIAVIVGSRGQG